MSQNVPYLSDKQAQAIDLLMTNNKLSDIAQTLEIDRRTLWRWRKLPAFRQMLTDLRTARQEEIQSRFSEIMRLSLLSIERELKLAEDPRKYNPLETAITVLKIAQPHRILSQPPEDELPAKSKLSTTLIDCHFEK